MTTVIVSDGNGNYLNHGRGYRRRWTKDLGEAQVFRSKGWAKRGFNLMYEPRRRGKTPVFLEVQIKIIGEV